MDVNTMFAVWRIEPPWKPITKKGIGVRMGGGKGAINHYVTPVKADRIIVEMGGECPRLVSLASCNFVEFFCPIPLSQRIGKSGGSHNEKPAFGSLS